MTSSSDEYIIVGKIGSTFGVRGFLKIDSYTEIGVNILNYTPWYLSFPGEKKWIPFSIEKSEIKSNRMLVKFETIDSPEEARLLTNKHIAVKRTQLPILQKNEYYWTDLIGLTVINREGQVYGKVIYLMETGSNDVLVVKGEKEHGRNCPGQYCCLSVGQKQALVCRAQAEPAASQA